MLLNIGGVRAVVTDSKCLLFEPGSPSSRKFLEIVMPKIQASGGRLPPCLSTAHLASLLELAARGWVPWQDAVACVGCLRPDGGRMSCPALSLATPPHAPQWRPTRGARRCAACAPAAAAAAAPPTPRAAAAAGWAPRPTTMGLTRTSASFPLSWRCWRARSWWPRVRTPPGWRAAGSTTAGEWWRRGCTCGGGLRGVHRLGAAARPALQ